MRIEVSRFIDGSLKVIVHHEEDSYFWKSSLTECPKFENEKLKLEVLTMVDMWNKEYHEEFELLWDSMLVNIYNREKEKKR